MESEWSIRETRSVVKGLSPENHPMINEYCIMNVVGEGKFGKVKLCKRIAGTEPYREFAIKIIDKRKLRKLKEYRKFGDSMRVWNALEGVEKEISIMRKLYHKNIALLFEVIDDPESDKMYMITEYMDKGPCMKYDPESKNFTSPITNSTLPEDLARQYMHDITCGIQYLHQKGICHRDIKPDNILLNTNNRCHIIDFGCAEEFEDGDVKEGLLKHSAGTFHFFPPECCAGKEFCGYKADVWAVGIVFYIFLFGKLPFPHDNVKDLFDCIQESDLPIPDNNFTDLCIDLLINLLKRDPKERIGTDQILDHPWMKE